MNSSIYLSIYMPMAFYLVYIFFLLFLNFRVRFQAVKNGDLPASYFELFKGTEVPDRIVVYGRHIDNQFPVPPYFMMTCLVAAQVGVVTGFTIAFAWGFVLCRMVHSYIHLGSNKVLKRAKAYFAGWGFIFLIWGQILIFTS